MNLDVFKRYDIRGEWNKDFNEDDITLLCQVLLYGICAGKLDRKIVIGRDARPSSKTIHKILLRESERLGFEILDLGLCTTPMVNMVYSFDKSYVLRVMITASHNPWNYNGFKLFWGDRSFVPQDLADIRELFDKISSNPHAYIDVSKEGKEVLVNGKETIGRYLAELTSAFEKLKMEVPFVVDCMNGSSGEIVKDVLEKLGKKNVVLHRQTPFYNLSEDDQAAAVSPDPTDLKKLESTLQLLKDKNFPFALVLDGDADRLTVLTVDGVLLGGDELLGLFSQNLLAKEDEVISNLASSARLLLMIDGFVKRLLFADVGVLPLKTALLHYPEAKIGGEPSGHFIFKNEHFNIDDGIFAAAKFLEAFEKKDFDLAEWTKSWPESFSLPAHKVYFEDRKTMGFVLRGVFMIVRQIYFNYLDACEKDGIPTERYRKNMVDTPYCMKVHFGPDAWMLVRTSNTENYISIKIEAGRKPLFDFIKDEVLDKAIVPAMKDEDLAKKVEEFEKQLAQEAAENARAAGDLEEKKEEQKEVEA